MNCLIHSLRQRVVPLIITAVIVSSGSSCSETVSGPMAGSAVPSQAVRLGEAVRKPPVREKDEPKISMSVAAPVRMQPEPEALPDFKPWEVEVQYKNEGSNEVVLYPYLNIEVFDAAGKPVERDAYMGIGFRTDDWLTTHEKAFLVIPPGQTKKLVIDLFSYVRLVDGIGWEFKTPGTYKLVVTYDFDRQRFEQEIAPWLQESEVEAVKQPDRLWNRALEMKRTADVTFEVHS